MANIITDSVNDINISGKRGEKKDEHNRSKKS